jgi:hypothetical protein
MKLKYLLIALICFFALNVSAQDGKKTFEVYGFTQLDGGYNVNQINPDWYDAMRPDKLPSFKDEFAPDGKYFMSARQSKFGFKSSMPTSMGDFTTKFEIDLFGVGDRVGQTDLRLRHAYGQLGHFGAGQTNSVYMDIDVFPNSLEYWGPSGMIFFRNLQVRYMPLMDKTHDLAFALENPGASGDAGVYAGRFELSTVKPHFQLPDFTAHYRYTGDWGYVQFGGIVGSLKWTNTASEDTLNLSGTAVRWSGTASTNLKLGKQVKLILQGLYGEGMENYLDDGPADVALQSTSDPFRPKGKALPVWSVTAFIDIAWSKLFTSTAGYSVITIKNTDLQTASEFKQGQYFLANLLYYPVNDVMAGVEFVYGRRDNYKDGFHSDNPQVRFAFRYNFSQKWTF